MQGLESVEVNVVLALALVSLGALRNSWPAAIAGFFFLVCAILNGSSYVGSVYVSDAVYMYFFGAICNLILMVALVMSGRQSTESYLLALCLFLLCAQYVIMALDEYKFAPVQTWLWSWSYEFRAGMDALIVILGAVSAVRGNHRRGHYRGGR